VLVAAVALTAGASGYTSRYAISSEYFDQGLVSYFADSQRADDPRPIFMTPEVAGMLTGDGIERDVRLIALNTPCDEVEALRSRAWVILRDDALYRRTLGFESGACLRSAEPAARIGQYRVYEPLG
jgi:hypothetical protein